MTKEEIKTVVELFISWNGENEPIDISNLDYAIDYINDCIKSSLPSNLDEAAENIISGICPISINGEYSVRKQLFDVCIAVAEWMAEQGVTMEITDDTDWADLDSFVHKNVTGGSIIQIRKK